MLFINACFFILYILSKNIIFSFMIIVILYLTNAIDMINIFGFSGSLRSSNTSVICIILVIIILLMIYVYTKGRKVLWKN